MNSKNIIIFDESKFGNGSLFCFVGLVYKDTGIFNKIENELQQIKGKGAVLEVINRLQKGRPFLCLNEFCRFSFIVFFLGVH